MLNNLEQRVSKFTFFYRKVFFNSKAFQAMREASFILGLTVLGITLSLQGWKSLIPAFDMLTYFDNAYNLLHYGVMPQYGDISSYASFSPPGTSWLIALGMLVLKDPRLYEKAGSTLLHVGTLWGIFILSKKLFGTWAAYFATLLYGLSSIGLDYAGSLWPIGHPFFYIWMVYFARLWAQSKKVKYLTLAVITWAIGMYIDMAIAPSLFILPAIWFFFRPPIFSKSLFFGFAVCSIVWFPYLKFEAGRDFLDLRSQIGRRNIFPVNYRGSWCDSHAMLAQSQKSPSESIIVSNSKSSSRTTSSNLKRLFSSLENKLAEGLISNFNHSTSIPGGNLLLLWMGLISLVFLGMGDLLPRIKKQLYDIPPSPSYCARLYQWSRIILSPSSEGIDEGRFLAVSLSVPWLILILVAEPDRPERFTWLWGFQLLAVSLFSTRVLPHLRAPKIAINLTQLFLLILILPFASLPTRFENWSKNGWAGQDADEKQVADYVASHIKMEGKYRASIGYQTFIYPFMANYNIINPRYKVGAEFDLLFKFRYGILNTTQCAEGFSSRDEYRVVETIPKIPAWSPRDHFVVAVDNHFILLSRFGSYEVFKRQ